MEVDGGGSFSAHPASGVIGNVRKAGNWIVEPERVDTGLCAAAPNETPVINEVLCAVGQERIVTIRPEVRDGCRFRPVIWRTISTRTQELMSEDRVMELISENFGW